MADFEKENFSVTIADSGVPSGGRYVASIVEEKPGNVNKFVTRYAYGLTYDEALEEAKKIVEAFLTFYAKK